MATCLILNGHPLTPSFNQALADAYAEAMRRAGVEVHRLDLATLAVPDLDTRLPDDAQMNGDVLRFWERMVWADHVVIVHPLWWGSMPAKLKALFDIGLQHNKAYRYEDNRPLPLGLLKGRSARLIVTSDTPGWFMTLAYGNAHFRTMKNQVLGFVGLAPVAVTHLSTIKTSTPKSRAGMLERVARDGASDAEKLLSRPSPPRMAQ